MRELKFRAWDKTNKRFVTDSNLCIAMTGEILGWLANEGEYDILQYTGLKDKNGKEIYEGDIVVKAGYPWFTDKGEPNYVSIVEWYFSGWQASAQSINSDNRGMLTGTGLNDEGLDEGAKSDWEVIGNIYENPELLQRGE